MKKNTLPPLVVLLLFCYNTVYSQIGMNKIGVAHYTSNCMRMYIAKLDTFQINIPQKNVIKIAEKSDTSKPVNIRIRCCPNIFTQEPLLVVDGLVYEYGKLSELDPNDILSIVILKEVAAGALYGCKAANGVILITTKGSKSKTIFIRDFLDHKPISRATISLISKKDSSKREVLVSDENGRVKIEKNNYDLNISAVGYKNFSTTLMGQDLNIPTDILLERDYKSCQEAIVSPSARTIRCGMRCMSLIVSDDPARAKPLTKNFKIYPNPIQSNSTLNIEWEQREFGDFMFQLCNQSGQLIFSKEITISEEQKLYAITMPSVIAGNYFLKLLSKTSGKSYSEKLIVE